MIGGRQEKVNQLLVITTHQDDYFQKRPSDVFSIGRNYIDLSYPLGVDRVLGTLYINVEIKAIDDIFSHLGLYQYNGIRILDAADNLIYTNGVIPKNSIEITELCGLSEWRVFIDIDYQQASQNIINMVWFIYIIVIVVLLILLALSIIYSNVFSRPVRALLRGMKQVEEGNFNIQLHVKGQDEIKLLAEGFMQMTAKIENYIQTSLLSKLRLREAELSALRARIKPHFIYNSLEIIRMNAIANDDESTAELTFHLAEFMHTLIESGNNEVPLSQELNLLRSYLAFIDIRYERRIEWKIRVDDELSETLVLSLMIQPVVENAIIHGIKPMGKGYIDINISREKDDLAIIITDDGIGMDEETKEKLNVQMQSVSHETEAKKDEDSIGLKNVHDRLRYTYGNSYGVSVKSSPGKGTEITLLLPFRLPEKRVTDV
jgi:two-component system sensor histidine kinase YesM